MIISKTNIFRDSEQDLSSWDRNTFVQCPSCSKQAIVKNEESVFQHSVTDQSRLQCSHCALTVYYPEMIMYNLQLSENCGNCGVKIERNIPTLKKPKKSLLIKCSNCGNTEKHTPSNAPYLSLFDNQHGVIQQHFGVTLWLQAEFKNNTLWAYNYDHLAYLKNYISADLRERSGMSMSAKLPQFMKDKKNRAALLIIIERLFKKHK